MKLSDFLIELRRAVNEASVSLAKKNIELFDEYFERQDEADSESAKIPKTVRLNYPVVEDDVVRMKTVDVPLISLIPLTSSKIGKATFSMMGSVGIRLKLWKIIPIFLARRRAFLRAEMLSTGWSFKR